jgi:hypothetical protein
VEEEMREGERGREEEERDEVKMVKGGGKREFCGNLFFLENR